MAVVAMVAREEKRMPRRTRPALVWAPEQGSPEEREHWERVMALEPPIAAVSEDYEADRSVGITIRFPAALHERLESIRWELRCHQSELIRGILWDALLNSATFLDVDEGVDPPAPEGEAG